MLPLSPMPSTNFAPCPPFVGRTIHGGTILRLCPIEGYKNPSMKRMRNGRQLMFSNTDQTDLLFCDRIVGADVRLFGRMSRKRAGPLLKMSNQRKDDDDDNNYTDKTKTDAKKRNRRRREPGLSLFDKLVDKVLMLDLPTIISILAIIIAVIVPKAIATDVGLTLALAAVWVIPLFASSSEEPENSVQKSSAKNLSADEEDTRDFTMFYLVTVYLGIVFLDYISGSSNVRSLDVGETNDYFSVAKVIVVTILTVGLLSNSDMAALSFSDNNDGERGFDTDDEEDAPSISAAKELMDIWDEEFERKTTSDDQVH